jgi:hypothetical protein
MNPFVDIDREVSVELSCKIAWQQEQCAAWGGYKTTAPLQRVPFGPLIQNSNLAIDFQFRRLPENGGAHDQFWRTFYGFLEFISREVTQNEEPEAKCAFGEHASEPECSMKRGLSTVRVVPIQTTASSLICIP